MEALTSVAVAGLPMTRGAGRRPLRLDHRLSRRWQGSPASGGLGLMSFELEPTLACGHQRPTRAPAGVYE